MALTNSDNAKPLALRKTIVFLACLCETFDGEHLKSLKEVSASSSRGDDGSWEAKAAYAEREGVGIE